MTILDKRAVEYLTPPRITGYLSAYGWSRSDETELAVYFSKGDESILVPKKVTRDYAIRVREIVCDLQRIEERSAADVIARLGGGGAVDTIRMVFSGAGTELGMLPVEDGARVYSEARELLFNTAASALTPRREYTKRRPKLAHSYVEQSKFGQTQLGSYVFVIHSPIDIASEEGTRHQFGRKVVEHLAIAMQTVKDSIVTAKKRDVEKNAETLASRGVSANLCRSLASLIGHDLERFTFDVEWSPEPDHAVLLPKPIEFTRADADPMVTAAGALKEDPPTATDIVLKGKVVRLYREAKAKGPGEVTLRTKVDGTPKTVKVVLGPKMYSDAASAHDEEETVKVRGNLRTRGRYFVLEAVDLFQVL